MTKVTVCFDTAHDLRNECRIVLPNQTGDAMRNNRKDFWISLCLLNLCVVAFLGFGLRSKILFSLPGIDYRNLLSAHSHFAFTGWAGLTLITLFIYELLPEAVARKPFYQCMLAGIELCSLGMAVTFPVWGYTAPAIAFSSLYIFVSFALAPVFIKDMLRYGADKTVRLLSFSALASLVVSAIGPLLLVSILITKSGNAILYRDAVYLFLHFQYNGFFTLAVFALVLNHLLKKGIAPNKAVKRFAAFLCASVLPTLALSLLWHNSAALYTIAAIGCALLLLSLFLFVTWLRRVTNKVLFQEPVARVLWLLSAFSFGLKLLLSVGTIFPPLGRAVYGDRPVIIGFLHLVFLGFLTFFMLALMVTHGYFKKFGKTIAYPFIVFGAGIIVNELLLMLQGLGNLLRTTASIFNWLLWYASIVLFCGALLIAIARFRIARAQPVE